MLSFSALSISLLIIFNSIIGLIYCLEKINNFWKKPKGSERESEGYEQQLKNSKIEIEKEENLQRVKNINNKLSRLVNAEVLQEIITSYEQKIELLTIERSLSKEGLQKQEITEKTKKLKKEKIELENLLLILQSFSDGLQAQSSALDEITSREHKDNIDSIVSKFSPNTKSS
jgi:hypothetical protein